MTDINASFENPNRSFNVKKKNTFATALSRLIAYYHEVAYVVITT